MTGGFLETLINFRHIREDLIKTKKEVDKFNKSRTNLINYKNKINQLLDLKQSLKPNRETIQKKNRAYQAETQKRNGKSQKNSPQKPY